MSLDSNDIPNKMMVAPPSKKEFHFSGAGLYHNLTILAEHIEEATKHWLASRQLIDPPAEQSTPAEPTEQSTAASEPIPEEKGVE